MRIKVAAAVSIFVTFVVIQLPQEARAGDEKEKPKEVICEKDKFLVNGKEQDLTIRVGESVIWVNKDADEHDATSFDDSPEKFKAVSIPESGRSKPLKFEKAGTYKYYCTIHGKKMAGTIIVKK